MIAFCLPLNVVHGVQSGGNVVRCLLLVSETLHKRHRSVNFRVTFDAVTNVGVDGDINSTT